MNGLPVINTDYYYTTNGNVNTGSPGVKGDPSFGCGCGYMVGDYPRHGYDPDQDSCIDGYTFKDTDESGNDIDCCCSDTAGYCGIANGGCQTGYSCPFGADPRQCCSIIASFTGGSTGKTFHFVVDPICYYYYYYYYYYCLLLLWLTIPTQYFP